MISNMAGVGGGGIQLSYISNGIVDSPHMANFTDCVFDGNRGNAGGGMYVYPSFTGKWTQLVWILPLHICRAPPPKAPSHNYYSMTASQIPVESPIGISL